ncbi:hypothetical protein JA1_001024 [Spathaspora sp. JA1]|nr:hypothetical protein JA1_001024 [Spathaspora sp. JA1]
MKASTIITPTIALATAAQAATPSPQDVEFLTALVHDFQDHKTQYFQFFATATAVPADLAPLATHVLTYTDDSYTTLLQETSINIPHLQSYVTKLPWHTRIQFDAGAAGEGTDHENHTGTDTATGTGTGTGAVTVTTTPTGTGTGTGTQTVSPTGRTVTQTTTPTTSPSPARTTGTGTHTETHTTGTQTTTTTGGVGSFAPVGAMLGVVAFAML